MKVVNYFNYDHSLHPGECNTLPSMTVPDTGLTFRQQVDRHMRGIPGKVFSPVYSDKYTGLEHLDRFERADLSKRTADFVADTRGRLVSAKQKRIKEIQEQAIISAYESRKVADSGTTLSGSDGNAAPAAGRAKAASSTE